MDWSILDLYGLIWWYLYCAVIQIWVPYKLYRIIATYLSSLRLLALRNYNLHKDNFFLNCHSDPLISLLSSSFRIHTLNIARVITVYNYLYNSLFTKVLHFAGVTITIHLEALAFDLYHTTFLQLINTYVRCVFSRKT